MKFKIGDRVTILRASTRDEDYDSWNTCWCPDMNKYIGTTQIIDYINGPFNSCRFVNIRWNFPLFVLKKVEVQLLFEFMYED